MSDEQEPIPEEPLNQIVIGNNGEIPYYVYEDDVLVTIIEPATSFIYRVSPTLRITTEEA